MNELSYIISEITEDIKRTLDKAGIYYRIFARQKSNDSIKVKLLAKEQKYRSSNTKMQDIIGIRIVFYFIDDVEIINEYLHNQSLYLDDSDSQNDIEKANHTVETHANGGISNLFDKIFMPMRLNLIFSMEENHTENLNRELENVKDFPKDLIDSTYEIQLRTVLSEGWHEIEHDLRYKTKDETWWNQCELESRMLNGIYATLETCERSMNNIFSTISYKNYKSKNWSAMIKNHLRIKISGSELSHQITDILNNNNSVAKTIFRVDRKKVISILLNSNKRYPLSINNIVYLLNRLSEEPNDSLLVLENSVIKEDLDKLLNS